MIKIGDNVRFLNAVGGGQVTKVDAKNNLVYVEDEDGFEVPVLAKECVVVGPVNETTNFPRKDFSQKHEPEVPQPVVLSKEQREPEATIPVIETSDGDTLRALLAFFPTDIKRINETSYDCYFVNDSNYYLFYNFVIGEKEKRISIANGTIEPNFQESIAHITKEQLNDWEQVRVQIIPFKKDKVYSEQPVLDFLLKINPIKFYKLHSFIETDYFDEPCMLIDLIEAVEKKQLADISPDTIKQAMYQKAEAEKPFKPTPKKLHLKPRQEEVLEVDLHIHSLLETTAGMSNADMLTYQLDVVRKTLNDHKKQKGLKVVFIHGKGEGVLRGEIEKELKTNYKDYYFQDASFREYGFGATMVTIR